MLRDHALDTRGETFFLNLRFMLILTVFIGNAIEPLTAENGAMHSLYLWIFSFHMPLFVLVTGYFARRNLAGPSGRRLLLQIGMQYIIFQTLYSLLDSLYFHADGIKHSFFAPYLLLWFLASHACWRLLMLGMGRWRPGAQLAFAIAAGVLVGYLPMEGVWFSISRTFVYLPFFVLGYHFSFPAFYQLFRQHFKICAAVTSILLFAVLSLWGTVLPHGWLYGSMTFMQLHHAEWYAGAYRLGLYLLQALSSAAFLGWVPYGMRRITEWGRRTLYVFLLHGFLIRWMVSSGLYTFIKHPLSVAGLLLASVFLTILLAQPVVQRLLHRIVEPSVDWMLNLHRTSLRRSL